MVRFLILLIYLTLSLSGYSQSKSSLQKSWVKVKSENLSNQPIEPDTLYTRYTFGKSDEVKFSFYPGWDDYKQTYSQNEKSLTIGFDTYTIEELTDTSLTIAIDGFRRFRFLSERYIANQKEHLELLGEYLGKPLYKANYYVSPRYKKEKLGEQIQKNLEGMHGKNAAYFLATFIVTDEGKVENVKIIYGINEDFSNMFTKQILKTSKQWQPAIVNGQPIQTEITYEIKYFKSLTPYSSGKLN